MEEKKYIPIPVKTAKEIAEKYEKDIVIINAWDTVFDLLHTTTFGKTEAQKFQAASGGDITARALGAFMPLKQTHEDFREILVETMKMVGRFVNSDPGDERDYSRRELFRLWDEWCDLTR